MPQELITLVDEQDVPIGSLDKYEAHRHPARLHRAISVWLWRKNPNTRDVEVLIQKRSDQKIVGAGWWGNTVCGNVWWQESYEDCAKRRLAVELNIVLPPELKKLYAFRYQAYCNDQYGENEWDTVFVGEVTTSDFVVQPNPAEVAETRWVSFSELRQSVKKAAEALPKGRYVYPTETVHLQGNALKDSTPPLTLRLNSGEIVLASWTVMIVLDDRLSFA